MNLLTRGPLKNFKFIVAVACCALAVIFTNTLLYADENAPAVTSTPADGPSLAPLMSALDKIGLAEPLNKAGINIYGYAEGGWFYDATSPRKGVGPTFIGYNNFKSDITLDKVSLNVERTVDPTKKQFDLGGRIEGIFGADAAFIHSNGMWDTQTGHNQWDLLQAYVDAALPYIPVKLRVGKWIELAGFEQFSANIYGAFGDPMRALYSYSYQFLYAEPGTQTGAFATYVLNPQWTFDAGFTLGWNQSIRDSNQAIDFLGRATWTPSDKTSVIFVMTEGPEFPIAVGHNIPPGDHKDYWTALDLVVTQKIDDKLSLGLGTDYVETPKIPGLQDKAKQWGGVAGYASYAIDPHFTLNTRLEWYKDAAQGFSTGAPVGANYYEVTGGVAIKPFPNDKNLSHLLFRPEIRYDHSDRSVFSTGERDQLTFSTDALITF
ncbi:MAG: outer membrane beta-barrel protein [Candidatus Omnitrophica bacterium]|nr:outer membrane beta-barrel protein [Candidatus Omnitrophota bacterium]